MKSRTERTFIQWIQIAAGEGRELEPPSLAAIGLGPTEWSTPELVLLTPVGQADTVGLSVPGRAAQSLVAIAVWRVRAIQEAN